jgi:hypothetical protein
VREKITSTSVYECIWNVFLFPQNSMETWQRKWEHLVGNAPIGVHGITEELQNEKHYTENECEYILQG